MKYAKLLFTGTLLCASQLMNAQFAHALTPWNMPDLYGTSYEDRIAHTYHAVMDMNGDGKPDLVNASKGKTSKQWDVYLNNGSGFNHSFIPWNMPDLYGTSYEDRIAHTHHMVIDMNGDGKPDLVNAYKGKTSKQWDVYLNNGNGFNHSFIPWNMPDLYGTSYEDRVAHTYHALIDMNGDGKPDLVNAYKGKTSKQWDVYLNNGNGFNHSFIPWNMPDLYGTSYEDRVGHTYHALIDMNGDGKPDLVNAYKGKTSKQWDVYLNNGNGFNHSFIPWNMPDLYGTSYEDRVGHTYHSVIDMNGDGKPDLVNAYKGKTSKQWDVYLNNGNGFNHSFIPWNMPDLYGTSYEDRVGHTYHSVIDMNGDGKPDLVNAYKGKTSKQWDVYINNDKTFINSVNNKKPLNLTLFPNPSKGAVSINANNETIMSVLVYNLSGKLVYSKTNINKQKPTIDLSTLTTGVYFVKATSNTNVYLSRLIRK